MGIKIVVMLCGSADSAGPHSSSLGLKVFELREERKYRAFMSVENLNAHYIQYKPICM